MNDGHLRALASPEWATHLEDHLVPWLDDLGDLGDDVVELGPGPGLTTDLLRRRFDRVTAIELDPTLAAPLTERAALRCDNWRSMLRAIDCSVSDTATRPSLSATGERRKAQKRLPMRGELSVTPFSATAPPVARPLA